jgi:hypothetical protein
MMDGARNTMNWQRVFEVAEKLLLPGALGALAWVTSATSANIAESQLALARSQDARQQVESRTVMEAKYLELFYKDINSRDERTQVFALSLVRYLDPELGSNLADLVKNSPGSPKSVTEKAASIKRDFDAFGALSSYKIGIYWDKDSVQLAKVAQDIQKKLEQRGFPGPVQLYPRSQSFLDSFGAPSGNEVRFEPGIEDEAADRLLSLMSELTPERHFVKRGVTNRTPNFVSLFLQ